MLQCSYQLFDVVANNLIRKLGDRQFYSLRELIDVGIFGSPANARKVLKEGRITYIKISTRRQVIPREALLDYLRKNSLNG